MATIYERKHQVTKEQSIQKANQTGKADFFFEHQGKQHVVTATKRSNGKITTETTHLKIIK